MTLVRARAVFVGCGNVLRSDMTRYHVGSKFRDLERVWAICSLRMCHRMRECFSHLGKELVVGLSGWLRCVC